MRRRSISYLINADVFQWKYSSDTGHRWISNPHNIHKLYISSISSSSRTAPSARSNFSSSSRVKGSARSNSIISSFEQGRPVRCSTRTRLDSTRKPSLDIVTSAVQSSSHAALAWTGVCFALQILLNPIDESKANREGIIYVTSRMQWYWTLSELLFEVNKPQVDEKSFTQLQNELKNRIIDLYKTLLSYQMKSVLSYYRNRGLALLGDIFRLDD